VMAGYGNAAGALRESCLHSAHAWLSLSSVAMRSLLRMPRLGISVTKCCQNRKFGSAVDLCIGTSGNSGAGASADD
jgi:hypothetical protein